MSAQHTPPHIIDDPSVWHAKDFQSPRSWVHPLSAASVQELVSATKAAAAAGKSFEQVTREDFPLPATNPLLQRVLDDIENGRGFSVIGGFPVDLLDYDEALIAYAGLSSHLGKLVDQTYAGAMKADVKDLGVPYGKDVRGYMSNAMLRFHTDGAVYTGLLCLQEAVEGGLSVLTSSGAMSNELLRNNPGLYQVLQTGFHHHRRGEHPPGDNPVSPAPIPVFAFYDDLLHCTYDRNQSLWAAEEGIEFSPRQIEAMDCLDDLMARPENQLHMGMRKGDIQYVNNFTVMHSRTAYVDGPGQKRHLVRFWIDAAASKRKGLTTRDLYVRDGGLNTRDK